MEAAQPSTNAVSNPRQQSLLATKLHVPLVTDTLISRPRLIERLNEGLKHKLTLISAPAGFGKTTLLSDWHIHQNLRLFPPPGFSRGSYPHVTM